MVQGGFVVLDFGSQYTQLIARRLRDLGVYSELLAYDCPLEEISSRKPKGIILSGGPNSVHDKGSPKRDVEELLKDLSALPEDKKKAIINNGGGHANHTLFWSILKKEVPPMGEIKDAIHEKFGSGPEFKKHFSDMAAKHFGSGWAWLVLNENKELEIATMNNPPET